MRKSFSWAVLTGILTTLCWLGLSSRSEAYPIGAVFCDSHGVRCTVSGQRISCFSKITLTYGGTCYCGAYAGYPFLTYSCYDPATSFPEASNGGSTVPGLTPAENAPDAICSTESWPDDSEVRQTARATE